MRTFSAAAIVVVILLSSRALHAETPPVGLRLQVDAPCTDETDFWQRIADRTLRVTRSAPDDAVDLVTVKIRTPNHHADGSFHITPAGSSEPSAERRVDGASCEEVASALSLAIALVYDPEATISPRPRAKESPPAQAASAPPPPPPPPPPPETLHWTMGAHFTTTAIRAVPLGGLVFGEIVNAKGVGIRLSFGAQYAHVEVAEWSAHFVWSLITPEVCPIRFSRGAFALTPCAGISTGLVESEPEGEQAGQSFTRAWIAPRAAMRARYLLGEGIGIEAQASFDVPLVRGRYTFGTVTAYSIPVIAPTFGIGVSFER